MPIYMKYSGFGATSILTGNLGGKSVNCAIRQVLGGHLQPGTYHISVPIKDPIHGMTAQVTPVEVRGYDATRASMPHLSSAVQVSKVVVRGYDPVKKKEIVGTAASKSHLGDAALGIHAPSPVLSKGKWGDIVSEKVGPGRMMFVLCDKPVLGRNTLIVSMGFADLIEALHSSGGATFTIS